LIGSRGGGSRALRAFRRLHLAGEHLKRVELLVARITRAPSAQLRCEHTLSKQRRRRRARSVASVDVARRSGLVRLARLVRLVRRRK
jgi:hypothetical protein